MVGLERTSAEIRELKLKVQGLREEYRKLREQYRRWMIISISMLCLSCFFILLLIVLDPNSETYHDLLENRMAELQSTDDVVSDAEKNVKTESPQEELEAPFLEVETPVNEETIVFNDNKTGRYDEPKTEVFESETVNGFALPTLSAKPQKKVIHYEVKKNDNLWKIAKKFYGSPLYIKKIKRDNSLISDRIRPGTRLVLIVDE